MSGGGDGTGDDGGDGVAVLAVDEADGDAAGRMEGVAARDADVVAAGSGVRAFDADGAVIDDVLDGDGDGERRIATLRLRRVAFVTPASLASQEYTERSAPLVTRLLGTSAVTLT